MPHRSRSLLLAAAALAVAACSPTPLTVTTAPPSPWQCPEVVDAARRTGWREDQLPWVDRIAFRESRCRPDAWSRTGDAGAMQINRRWVGWGLCAAGIACDVTLLFDLDVNLRAAAHVYAVQGPGAWSVG